MTPDYISMDKCVRLFRVEAPAAPLHPLTASRRCKQRKTNHIYCQITQKCLLPVTCPSAAGGKTRSKRGVRESGPRKGKKKNCWSSKQGK